ncbi:MAG: DNA translocase FtsK [Chloroflexota bacterium]|nr:DNA translocase FtsK [Chloroflexota bacterium]
MARVKARGRAGYRRPAAVTRRGARSYKQVVERQNIGRWLIAAAVVFVAVLIPFVGPIIWEALVDLRDALVRLLGLAVLLLVVALMVNGWLVLGRRFNLSATFWRRWLGALLLGVSVGGIMALFRPDWSLGNVLLSEVTVGGDLGHALMGSAGGILIWLALTFLAITLLAPRQVAWTIGHLPDLWRALVQLRLPDEVADGLRSIGSALLPKSEPSASDDLPTIPEEWEEPSIPGEQVAVQEVLPAFGEVPGEEGEALRLRSGQAVSPEPGSAPAGVAPLATGRPAAYGWELPLLDILHQPPENEVKQFDNAARGQLIEETLASFGVDARVVQINQGPTITQFGVEPGWEVKTRTVIERDNRGRPTYDKDGSPKYKSEVTSRTRVRVSQITSLANDLALALASPSIRIEAPVPGKPVVGIEVPNSSPSLVTLRSVIETSPFQRIAARSKLALALGKGVSGEAVAADLGRMPHLLIAGATGSGKSVCINSVISCLLMHNTPEELRFILIDPKRVELATFGSIPHLAFSHIVVEVEDVVGTLQAVIHEMETRYRRFASVGVRNIEAYNRSPRAGHKLPYWVVIIDELADLMLSAPYHVERQICRLAQLSRATGIHLIIATQRPSVDVVTGLIKANFPTRIAFAVSSQVDARTILDGAGAEKLLGRGDMLYMPTDAAKPKRLQGAFVSDQEIERIVGFWSDDRFRHLRPEVADHLLQEVKAIPGEEEEEDPLLERARELAQEHSRVSTSLLQRRLHIGYPRAARLIDQLEGEGVISGPEGGQSRRVLNPREEEPLL